MVVLLVSPATGLTVQGALMNEDDKKYRDLIFDSYNARSRPAVYLGVPIFPLLFLTFGGVAFGILSGVLFGWIFGGIVVGIFAGLILALRLITAVDDRYIRRVLFGIRRIKWNLLHGRKLMITPYNPNWRRSYAKRFAIQRYANRINGGSDEVSRPRQNGNDAREQAVEPDPN